MSMSEKEVLDELILIGREEPAYALNPLHFWWEGVTGFRYKGFTLVEKVWDRRPDSYGDTFGGGEASFVVEKDGLFYKIEGESSSYDVQFYDGDDEWRWGDPASIRRVEKIERIVSEYR